MYYRFEEGIVDGNREVPELQELQSLRTQEGERLTSLSRSFYVGQVVTEKELEKAGLKKERSGIRDEIWSKGKLADIWTTENLIPILYVCCETGKILGKD